MSGTRPLPRNRRNPARIHYLWKPAAERFVPAFRERVQPALAAAGVTLLGGFVPEEAPNDFLRPPVRQGKRLFAWLAHVEDQGRYDQTMRAIGPLLADLEERPPQVLELAPTARSLLR